MEAPVFPIVILVFSTDVEPGQSSIVETEGIQYQICSIPMTFEITLRDEEGGLLTESDYEIEI